ncbi:ATP synthase F1 subunit gamma [Thermotoga profunda]|uniref:ATP synthase F1 subunit gamma n=1 Tax=Thermotoga profunda TaxID=1508420 RepID=UPI0005975B44|nr:ATP synthase F1 subunit gamma [Thermotoga profunda]
MSRGKLRSVKARIQSTASLMKITRAMEMVARARVRKLEESFSKIKKFAAAVEEMREHIDFSSCEHPFITGKGKPVLIVVTSDMGLCGAFNAEILREAEHRLKDFEGLVTIGSKAAAHFSKNNKLIKSYQRMYDVPTLNFSAALMEDILKITGNVHVIYAKFINRLVQRPVCLQLTPVIGGKKIERYEYEPQAEELAANFVNFYVATKLHSVLFETKVSEMYARQNAMRNATENAKEMIRTLTLEYNKARQSSITQELIEIVTGAEALKEQ